MTRFPFDFLERWHRSGLHPTLEPTKLAVNNRHGGLTVCQTLKM
jgi:hypothetical protein